MRIITIGRQFGSGGRELGRRLAKALGYDYYDRQIVTAIAKEYGINDEYVAEALENNDWSDHSSTFMHSFSIDYVMQAEKVKLLTEQRRVIENIAKLGRDFLIVGRNADVLLEEYQPFNIFACAELEARVMRCQERSSDEENLTVKQLKKNIRRIDKNRARSREMITEKLWGEASSYHLVVNTTGWDFDELTAAVADYANRFFDRSAV